MSLVVPFDGSDLASAALARAVQFDSILDEGVLVISIVPVGNVDYAVARGWIDESDAFDRDRILAALRDRATQIAPDAAFHYRLTDRYAPIGTIANQIRQFARSNDASILFVGSENAGRIVRAVSVGQSVSADRAYDTMIVSHPEPELVDRLRAGHDPSRPFE
ncbi:universal stress family protein [Halovivax ruber XH-70]|uniref:Universal stress family protein n=1 Tax=Halovivax ruber (strain DSM 18193 / JCM 13892 / XH-70) TaxID=797302 RepID=L0I7G9_HALRX|nr:universal stress protein [Halovivax ruber]AGB15515.1 universal stress family protein [Halovivax ruber XH-70]